MATKKSSVRSVVKQTKRQERAKAGGSARRPPVKGKAFSKAKQLGR